MSRCFAAVIAGMCCVSPVHSQSIEGQLAAASAGSALMYPVVATGGMVATQEATATGVGVEILRRGGNAIDAAVAVGFALAVTLPRAGNLGGGGFMILHHAPSVRTVALDYRETAPSKATHDMYLDPKGNVDRRRARYTHLSVGVPGTVSGLLTALEKFGTLPREAVIAPALALARHGMVVSPYLAAALRARVKRMRRWPSTERVFYRPNGEFYEGGDVLKQPDLAWSLERISQRGKLAFYDGEIAERLVADMKHHGGLISRQDLQQYRTVIREPIWGAYRGYQIASMPPPSSGGVHLVQMLNVLEGFPVAYLGHNSAATLHLMAETMRRAYADRSEYLGDPDFWDVPVKQLISPEYAAHVRARIDRYQSTPSTTVAPGNISQFESRETTHFSVADGHGNFVSNTYTINFSFGTGIVADGTGILLNNEMDDFSAKPGAPNAYGLLGGEANAIEGGKRPLSSMTPTLVFRDGRPFLATGTPGGSRIITTTLQIIMNLLDHGMNLAEATGAIRAHHQWFPDELRVEKGLSLDTIVRLREMGHRVVTKRAMGSVQSVMHEGDLFLGVSDQRRPGALAAGISK